MAYFFLYPDGQVGFTAVIFLLSFPLIQVIVVFLTTTGLGATVGLVSITPGVTGVVVVCVLVTAGATSWVNFTRTVGLE